jgi:hypothetical protein
MENLHYRKNTDISAMPSDLQQHRGMGLMSIKIYQDYLENIEYPQ